MAILSNVNGKFAVDSTGAIQFSGQTGTSGYVLKSNGNAAPTWVDGSTVIGGPYLPLAGGILTGATSTASGISFTVGGTAVFDGDMTLPAAADHFLIGAGSLQTTGRIKFGLPSWNNSIGLESYWMVMRSNSNEGYKFIDSGGNTYVQFNAGTNSSGANYSYFKGRIGIGTDSPDAKLHIYGSASLSEMYLGEDAAADKAGILKYTQGDGSGTGVITLSHWGNTSTTQSLAIKYGGNVGIGTTSPDELLHLYKASGNAGLEIEAVSAGDPLVRFVSANNRTGNSYYTDGTTLARFAYDHADIAFKMFAHNNASVDFYLSETKAYFPSQNVGIGTTSPYSKLQVNSAVNTLGSHFGQGQNNTSGSFGGISLGYAENANASYRKVAIVAQATGDNAARQNLLFLVDSSTDSNSAGIADNKMILNYDGQIKIGNGSNIAINTNGGHYHAAGPAGFTMRQYQYYVDIPNGSTIDLFQNSSAYSDLQMTKISIVIYHSSRTYFAGMGCVGGYGFNLTGAGSGLANGGLTSAVVSTGIRKLQIANTSGHQGAARIFIEIMADSSVTVLNGSISAPY